MDNLTQEYISYLVSLGAMIPSGDNYQFDADLMEKFAPEVWKAHIEEIDDALNELLADGLIQAEWDFSKKDFFYSLTEKGQQVAESIINAA